MVLRTGISGGGIHGAGYIPIGAMGGCPSGVSGTYLLQAITTASPQTVTINRITPTGAAMTVYWGDGNSTLVADGGTAAISNTYASAGTYDIRVSDASLITQAEFSDARLWNFDSAALAANVLTHFVCYSVGGGFVLNSADMVAWMPSRWYLYSMPAGTYAIDSADMAAWLPQYWRLFSMPAGTYTIDSADMAAWLPTRWWLYSMPAGTYAIDSADMVAWKPQYWYLHSMPAGSVTISSSSDFDGWVSTTDFYCYSNSLVQADIDNMLHSLYNAFASRTASGGTIDVSGVAPSGVYGAACPPTTGKEWAYELKNDSCGINPTKKWSTVTFTP